MNNSDKKIKIINYDTLEECLMGFFKCESIGELLKLKWHWTHGDVMHVWPMKRAIKSILKKRRWGWCESKENIHVWFDRSVKFVDLLDLLAHEIGHQQIPWKRDRIKEEKKANTYGYVAITAYSIAIDLLNSKLKENL